MDFLFALIHLRRRRAGRRSQPALRTCALQVGAGAGSCRSAL